MQNSKEEVKEHKHINKIMSQAHEYKDGRNFNGKKFTQEDVV
jgi:hypothetical protein